LAEADLKEAAAPLAADKPWAADESLPEPI
jgi:hypothetical protein